MEKETTTLQSIACGGTGGDLTAVDAKDGKIVRIRPINYLDTYTKEELEPSLWKIQVGDEVFTPGYKSAPNYFALAYKNRVYSKNRVRHPLKRVDWEPGGDPAKINAANRGKSKFERISWDEALDIMESEIKRIIDTYGPYSVLTIGEDGHRESKNLHAGGGMHSTLMSKLGGYTREVRTPDSVEGWYWGAKHFWGSGCNKGLGMPAPPQTGYNPWHVLRDISEHSELHRVRRGRLGAHAELCVPNVVALAEVLGEGRQGIRDHRPVLQLHCRLPRLHEVDPHPAEHRRRARFRGHVRVDHRRPVRQGLRGHPLRRIRQGEGVRARRGRRGRPEDPGMGLRALRRSRMDHQGLCAQPRQESHRVGALQLRRHQGSLLP